MGKIPGYLLPLLIAYSMLPTPAPQRRVNKCLLHTWVRKSKDDLHQTKAIHMKIKQILPHLLISLTLSIQVRRQYQPITDISETRNETFSVTCSFLHSATQDFQNLHPNHHVAVACSGPYCQECTESFSSKCVFFLMCSAYILLQASPPNPRLMAAM